MNNIFITLPSLHASSMEQVLRIAFWTLACLQASALPIEDSTISSMRTNVKCPPDSTFYAPKNVEEQCITTAMDCIMRELDGAVREECADTNEDIDQAIDFFVETIKERTSEGRALTNATECACERWSQTPFSQFLNQVEELLMLQNVLSSR